MSYNGWKNYETWNAVLWCDNEEAIYRTRMKSKPKTAAECESFIREFFPFGTPDMRGMKDPYAAIDWDEIASHWKEDYQDEEETIDRKTIKWTIPMRERFRVVVQNAIVDHQSEFWFDGNQFLTKYATYLLQYLDQVLGEHHAA